MSCDAWILFAIVGVPCYESKTTCHMCTVVYCIFIQYYVSHCIDLALKINFSKLFVFYVFLFVVDVVHTFYHQSIYFLSSKY